MGLSVDRRDRVVQDDRPQATARVYGGELEHLQPAITAYRHTHIRPAHRRPADSEPDDELGEGLVDFGAESIEWRGVSESRV